MISDDFISTFIIIFCSLLNSISKSVNPFFIKMLYHLSFLMNKVKCIISFVSIWLNTNFDIFLTLLLLLIAYIEGFCYLCKDDAVSCIFKV